MTSSERDDITISVELHEAWLLAAKRRKHAYPVNTQGAT